MAAVLGTHSLESASLLVTRGDFAPLMQRIVSNLAKAKVCRPLIIENGKFKISFRAGVSTLCTHIREVGSN